MRVALNLEQLLQPAPGGVGRYTAELARLLPASIELVPFVALHPRRSVTAAVREHGLEGLDPVTLPLPRPLLYDAWHVLGAPALPRRIGDLDVVHAPSVAVPPRGGYRLVVTAHDAAPMLFPGTYPRRGRWFHARGTAAAARRADLVITVSRAAAGELAEQTAIEPDRVRVVPNGVDLRRATGDEVRVERAALDLGDRPYVLWVGSLEPRKNVRVLVDAFARWVSRGEHDHLLVLAGPAGWVEDRGAVMAPVRGLGDRVRTVGHVPAPRLRALYGGATLVAVPSLHEGFGLPALEAMAQGTPVLASDIPSLREVTSGAARLVPAGDPEAWAVALADLAADEPARTGMAETGLRHAAGFSWERCATATVEVYREALEMPPR